jgi:hypothetical protein
LFIGGIEMLEIIKWCNWNTGFLTAVLSVVGLLLSSIAIFVSIRTARLPYIKKVKLSYSTDMAISIDCVTRQSTSEIAGISVNVVNAGSRDINIAFLGLAVKVKTFGGEYKKIVKTMSDITYTGILSPASIRTEFYKKEELLSLTTYFSKNAKLYVYVRDTEDQEHVKRLGCVNDILRTINM